MSSRAEVLGGTPMQDGGAASETAPTVRSMPGVWAFEACASTAFRAADRGRRPRLNRGSRDLTGDRPHGHAPECGASCGGWISEKQGGGDSGALPTFVAITYPNIAHNFWDNYRLTGQYHLRQSKLSPPPK